MLHQIKLPAYHALLDSFLRLQYQFLEFVCTPKSSNPLTEDSVKAAFDEKIGAWLWSKLWSKKKNEGTELFRDAQKLTRHVNEEDPSVRENILNTFEHDITFHKHIDDAGFQFAYTLLRDDTKALIKPVMVAFYDFLCDGFFIPGLSAKQYYKRQDVANAFHTENKKSLRVCPACDGQPPTVIKNHSHADLDHFFPKSLYPFLSIHPYNLVPVCTECNGKFKKAIDPIKDHTHESLLDTFHPYQRPAIDTLAVQIVKGVNEGEVGELKVQMHDTSCKDVSKLSQRIENLNRIFDLQERWESVHLSNAIEDITQVFRDAKRRKEKAELREDTFVRERLEDILYDPTHKVGLKLYYIVTRSYANYILTNDEAFNNLAELADIEGEKIWRY